MLGMRILTLNCPLVRLIVSTMPVPGLEIGNFASGAEPMQGLERVTLRPGLQTCDADL